jgi:hypothetical protein
VEQKSCVFSKVFYAVHLGTLIYRLHNLILTFVKVTTYLYVMILMVMHPQRCFLFRPYLVLTKVTFCFPSALSVCLFVSALYKSNAECLVKMKVLQ